MKGLERVSNKQEVKNFGWKELFQQYISQGGQSASVPAPPRAAVRFGET